MEDERTAARADAPLRSRSADEALFLLKARGAEGVSCCAYGHFVPRRSSDTELRVALSIARHSTLELLVAESVDESLTDEDHEGEHSGRSGAAHSAECSDVLSARCVSLCSSGVWECPCPIQQLLAVRGADALTRSVPSVRVGGDAAEVGEDAVLVLLDDGHWALLFFVVIRGHELKRERCSDGGGRYALVAVCEGKLTTPFDATRTMHRVSACACAPDPASRHWRFVFCLFEGKLTALELRIDEHGAVSSRVMHFSHPWSLLQGQGGGENMLGGGQRPEYAIEGEHVRAALHIQVRDLVPLERHGSLTPSDSERIAVLYACRAPTSVAAEAEGAEYVADQFTVSVLAVVLDFKEGSLGAGEFLLEVLPSSHMLVPVMGAQGGVMVCDGRHIVFCNVTGPKLVAERSELHNERGASDVGSVPRRCAEFTVCLPLHDVPSLSMRERLVYVLGDSDGHVHVLSVDPSVLSRGKPIGMAEDAVGELRTCSIGTDHIRRRGGAVVSLCPLWCTRNGLLASPGSHEEVLGLMSVGRSGARDVFSVGVRWGTDVQSASFRLRDCTMKVDVQWLGLEQDSCPAWSIADSAFSSRMRNGRGELFLVGTDGELSVVSHGVRMSCAASCTQFSESPCMFGVRIPSLHSTEKADELYGGELSSLLVFFSYSAAAVTQTMLLEAGELAPCKFDGLCSTKRTLVAGLIGRYVVHVTTEAVSTVSVGSLRGHIGEDSLEHVGAPQRHFVLQYPASIGSAKVAAILSNAVVISSTQCLCCYLVNEVSGCVQLASRISLEQQPSALHVFEMLVDGEQQLFLAACLWFSPELVVFRLPDLQLWRRVDVTMLPECTGTASNDCAIQVRSLACLDRVPGMACAKIFLLGGAGGVLRAVDMRSLADDGMCVDGRQFPALAQWTLSFTEIRLTELRWPGGWMDSVALAAAGDTSYVIWLDEGGKLRISATVGCGGGICGILAVHDALENSQGLQGSDAVEWRDREARRLSVLWTTSGGDLCQGDLQFPSTMLVERIPVERPVLRAVWCGPGPPELLAVATCAPGRLLNPVDVQLSLLSAKVQGAVHLGAHFVTRVLYHPCPGEDSGLLFCATHSSDGWVSIIHTCRIVQRQCIEASEEPVWDLELVGFKVFNGSIFELAVLPTPARSGPIRLVAALNSQLLILEVNDADTAMLAVVAEYPAELGLPHSAISVGPNVGGVSRVLAAAVFGGIAEYEYRAEECTLRPSAACYGLPSISACAVLSDGLSLAAGRDSKLVLLLRSPRLRGMSTVDPDELCEISSGYTSHFFARLGLGRLGVGEAGECVAQDFVWGVATNGAIFVAKPISLNVAELFLKLIELLSDSRSPVVLAGGCVPMGSARSVRRRRREGEARGPPKPVGEHEGLVNVDGSRALMFLRLCPEAKEDIATQLRKMLRMASPFRNVSASEVSQLLADIAKSLL